jgi:hypothetical protein
MLLLHKPSTSKRKLMNRCGRKCIYLLFENIGGVIALSASLLLTFCVLSCSFKSDQVVNIQKANCPDLSNVLSIHGNTTGIAGKIFEAWGKIGNVPPG